MKNNICDFIEIKDLKNFIEKVRSATRNTRRLDDWFYIQEIKMKKMIKLRKSGIKLSPVKLQAMLFKSVLENLPINIRDGEIFAGSQNPGFSPTYALINPLFEVKKFKGYCDPMAAYNDISPDKKLGITKERIARVKEFWLKSDYVRELRKVYDNTGLETEEAVYFIEPVTGHTIADFRFVMKHGISGVIKILNKKIRNEKDLEKKDYYESMLICQEAILVLARRYALLAKEMSEKSKNKQKKILKLISSTCESMSYAGACNLYEAIQAFILLWMGMAIEQSPNPYAFSAGNLDRILQPFYEMDTGRHNKKEYAVELVRFLLAFFNVGDRSWAISQNILVGGKDEKNNDLTNEMTYNILESFYESNDPQPALSIKLHRKSPDKIYKMILKFLQTPGHSTPSLFNDDVIFEVLKARSIEDEDLKDYSTAGCQEILIMGKETGNTTNSWLNLAKILELTLNNGRSLISKEKIGLSYKEMGLNELKPFNSVAEIKKAFYKQLDWAAKRMIGAANSCTTILSKLPVPFLSAFIFGLETGIDMRDINKQGAKYNGSGCLIHGLANVADSFAALKYFFQRNYWTFEDLLIALRSDYKKNKELKDFFLKSPKYGNDIDEVDNETKELCKRVSEMINSQKNPWNNNFRTDWSTPSTHLLYGRWTGATPDGRNARKALSFGLDPSVGMAAKGLPPRINSIRKLPFKLMTGGMASHIGIMPQDIKNKINENPVEVFKNYLIVPLFGFSEKSGEGGSFYVYFNVDTSEHLRMLLKNPKKYCPTGIYIMRIHGTFVNFLDLSPDIQEDIIQRLDLPSTKI